MKPSRWRWVRAVLAALAGLAVLALLVWLVARNRTEDPRALLLLAALAALGGVVLTIWLVWRIAGPQVRVRHPHLWLLFAALAGVTLTALLAQLLIGPVVGTLPGEQVFLRAYLGMLAAVLSLAAGFALIGALSAPALPLAELGVPPRAVPYRLGVTLAVVGGLLVIPALLILVGAAVSREGVVGPLLPGGLLGAVAALYGLTAGGLLGLLTLRVGQVWRPALAGLVGAGLGGAACGLVFGLFGSPDLIRGGWGFLLLAALFVAAIHLAWGLGVRAALNRLLALGRRSGGRAVPVQAASRAQVNVVATLALLLLGGAAGPLRTLGDFLTTRRVNDDPPRAVRPLEAPACTEPQDPLERAVWRVTTRDGRPDLSCRHTVYPLLRIAEPSLPGLPGEPLEPPSPAAASGFDHVAGLVLTARREVLFTTMSWDEGPDSPGATLAHALARLYARVKANPAAYPDGLSVRLTLGNYPVVSILAWGAEVWDALHDLRAAGVPLSDPAHGWRVQLGNYAGTFPHSHAKLLVVDGQLLMAAGFNYDDQHYPTSHPSGRGIGLYDLALVVRGPAAQNGVGAFEDLWTRSKVVECPETPQAGRPHGGCRLGALGQHDPLPAARRALPQGGSRVFSLYRREGFTEADQAVAALLDTAQQEVMLLHIDFSMNVGCIIALLNPGLCTDHDRLPWMTALLGALERGVTVRLMTKSEGVEGIENRIALAYLQREMRRRGIPASRFEARGFPQPLHAKVTLVDRRMLVVGSMNLHYSSWTQGPLGLAEYDLATSDPARTREFRQLYDGFWAQAEAVTLPPFLTEVGAGQP
ncbi:hypothetical protein DEIPH_ctg069orf0014 [Deinococcus phoenicis]|uniref:PLD phosphodiesterase domain-containing protein n=1 Tax=Deinococcus phoenicis TaxID=1476583 RepID=A0A016QLP5_9DEIO|nr:phospholipase D-like domain-containing protein [Deinococcus phoenicis]EYB66812.1 hypothetical protein DEIPH_ctg069orf0014 [Deinococcus phoenicis]